MAGQMGGGMMPPGAAEQMKNMSAEDMKRAAEEMKNLSPEQLKAQYEQAQSHAKATANYKYSASEQLKKDGNALVGAQKYTDAIEKYMRVKNNLAEDDSRDAKTLRVSCMLNMALCFNKTKRHNSAISECSEVLTLEPRSLKAYFRRGQAYVAKGELESGVKDLKRAAKLSPSDEIVAGELKAAIEDMKSKGLPVPECPEYDHAEAPAVASSSGGFPGMPGMPGMTPDIQAKMAEMMSDPNAMEQMSNMMSNLSEDQVAEMAKMNPMMAGMDPEMIKRASGMMKNMNPKSMETMMKMAQSFTGDGASEGDMMAKMQKELANPEMREAMVEMVQGMDPETLKEMTKSMGMDMDDAQAEQAVNALKNISPKTMDRMLGAASMLGGVYSRFKRPIDFALRHKRLALSLFVVWVAVGTSYVIRWWRRRGGVEVAIDEAPNDTATF